MNASAIRFWLTCCVLTLGGIGDVSELQAQSGAPKSIAEMEMQEQELFYKEQLIRMQRDLEMLIAERAVLEKQIEARNQELIAVHKATETLDQELLNANVSTQSYPEVLAMLLTMRVELKVDLAGLRARLESIRKITGRDNSTMVINEKKLELTAKMLEVSRQIYMAREQQFESGAGSNDARLKAQQELTEAELRFLEAEALSKSPKSASLNIIQETTFEIAEKEARLAEVETMLQSTAGVRSAVRETENQRQHVEQLNAIRDNLRTKIEETEMKIMKLQSAQKNAQKKLEIDRKKSENDN